MFKRRNNLSLRLAVENLESRNLLSATPIIVAAAAPGHFQADHSSNEVETHLFASLTDPVNAAASAKVQYESQQEGTKSLEQTLSVQVRGAAANATLDVTLDGVVVGKVVTDANGAGRLRLSDHGKSPNQQPIPAIFPAVVEGSAIRVGAFAGVFSAKDVGEHTDPPTPPAPPAPRTETHLTAALADPNAAAVSGKAKYEAETEHGATTASFAVEIAGAGAKQTLDVAIDGTVVGQITTDDLGAGKLKISPTPAGFPTVAAGSIVTVGTAITGTLAIPTSGGDDHDHQGDNGDDDQGDEVETHLLARLTDPANAAASASAQYESEQQGTNHLKQSFTLQVRGAAASATLDVTIAGVVVGQVVTDANGNGKLRLSDHGNAPGQQPIPANFPAVADGSTISVGTLAGAFAVQSGNDDHVPPTPPAPPAPAVPPAAQNKVHLGAALADASNAAISGKVRFESESEHGHTKTVLQVEVRGAAANQSYDVAIDGVVVGQLQTNALGSGKLKLGSSALPAGFPTVSAGSVVTVGTTITGTLAKPKKN